MKTLVVAENPFFAQKKQKILSQNNGEMGCLDSILDKAVTNFTAIWS